MLRFCWSRGLRNSNKPARLLFALRRKLAGQGCSLVFNYISDSSKCKTESLAQGLEEEHGIQVYAVQAAVGSVNGPAHIVSIAKNHFSLPKSGNFTIDIIIIIIIIITAGVSVNRPLEECDADHFAFQFSVNVRGPLLIVKAALPCLPTDRSVRIVNLSSVSSSMGFFGQSVHYGTKAAIESMTRTWSRELAERCTVNAVNPGPVAGDMYDGTSVAFKEGIKKFIQAVPLTAEREGIDEASYVDAAIAAGRPSYDHETAGIIAMMCTPDSV